MRRALREFLRPIPDEAIPLVRGSMARGVTTLTLVATIAGPLSTLATIPSGLADPLRCVVNALALTVVFLALYLASRVPFGKRHPDWMLLAFVLAGAVAVAFSGWSTRDGVNHIPYFTLFLPAIVAGFAPWRPSLSLALSLPLFAIWYAGQRLLSPAVSPDELSVALMVLPLNAVVAAAANQSHVRPRTEGGICRRRDSWMGTWTDCPIAPLTTRVASSTGDKTFELSDSLLPTGAVRGVVVRGSAFLERTLPARGPHCRGDPGLFAGLFPGRPSVHPACRFGLLDG